MEIYKKLLEVRKRVEYFQKENQGHGFKYVSSSQVLSAFRVAMNDLGLLLIPNIIEANVVDHNTQGGKTWKFTTLKMMYEWVNAENPEERFSVPFYAQGMDDMEKGVGKALTYGEKFFLLKFFNIPTDSSDPDAFKPKETTTKESISEDTLNVVSKKEVELPPKRNSDSPATEQQWKYLKTIEKEYNLKIPAEISRQEASAMLDKHERMRMDKKGKQ